MSKELGDQLDGWCCRWRCWGFRVSNLGGLRWERAEMFPGHVESEVSVDKFSPRFLNLLLRLPGTKKNGAQDKDEGIRGSQKDLN